MIAADPLPLLHTARLLMRPMEASDAEQVVRWRNAPHVREMCTCHERALTVERHLDWFIRTRMLRIDYILVLRASNRPIGSVSLSLAEDAATSGCSAQSGRYIGEPDCLGQGYGHESAVRWLDFGFFDLGLDSIFSHTRRDNFANIRLNHRLGYSRFCDLTRRTTAPDGEEWIDMCLYRDDWRRIRGRV